MGDLPAAQANRPTCSICGLPHRGTTCCRCRGWRCPVCGQPAYLDESVAYDAHDQRHVRCNGGVPHPRPAWMERLPSAEALMT